jgi:tetratricopeptide (TPR) repeat protein
LKNDPVVARPPSNLYRFQKMGRRNKVAFAATGAVAAALVIGLAATTWEYVKERKARQQAAASSELLQQLLSSADPDGLKGSDYTVRQLLDDFSAGLTNQYASQPEVEATIRLTIGWTYARLSVVGKAERNLRQAVELRRRALGPQHLDTLEAQHLLAKFLADKRDWEEAEKLSFDTWQARRRLLGPEHRDTLRSQQTYAGALLEGVNAEDAVPIEREVLQIRQRVLPPDDYDTIDSLGTLAQVLIARGDLAEGEDYLRQALAGFKRIGYADKLDGITCAKEIALARLQQGDSAEAVNVLEEVHPRAITNLGPDHIMTLLIQRVLARALAEEGQLDDAEALCKETLDPRLHSSQERYGTARTQLTLGRVLVELGKPDEAAPLLEKALTFFREDAVTKLPRPYLAAQAANWLGTIQLGRQDYPQAEKLLLTGWEQFFAPTADMTPKERRVAVGHIVQLYQAWPKPERADYWQKKLDSLPPLASKPGGAP